MQHECSERVDLRSRPQRREERAAQRADASKRTGCTTAPWSACFVMWRAASPMQRCRCRALLGCYAKESRAPAQSVLFIGTILDGGFTHKESTHVHSIH